MSLKNDTNSIEPPIFVKIINNQSKYQNVKTSITDSKKINHFGIKSENLKRSIFSNDLELKLKPRHTYCSFNQTNFPKIISNNFKDQSIHLSQHNDPLNLPNKSFDTEESFISNPDSYCFFDLGIVGNNWTQYVGEVLHGKKHGYGKWILNNGEIFEGDFQNDQAHGNGKFTAKTGEILLGIWKNNILQYTEYHKILDL